MTKIHHTAIVEPGAQLDAHVEIGAYAVIGPHACIGKGTVVGPHVVIEGHTSIGHGNRIYQFASIGAAPQDKKYRDEPTRLEIGNDNTIRECVTINRGTVQDDGVTRVGNGNWIMAYVHIGDWVILGGNSQVHQFCKIGAHAMTGTGTVVLHDVPPYVMASGNTAGAHGINSEGLRRRGFSPDAINAVRRAYKTLYKSGLTLDEARAQLHAQAKDPANPDRDAIALLSDFLASVTRGIVR